MTEGRNEGMTDKANTKCPLAILWRGHKKDSYNFVTEMTVTVMTF